MKLNNKNQKDISYKSQPGKLVHTYLFEKFSLLHENFLKSREENRKKIYSLI